MLHQTPDPAQPLTGTARDLVEDRRSERTVRGGESFVGAESIVNGKSRWSIVLRGPHRLAVQFVSPEGESLPMLRAVTREMLDYLGRSNQ